ncbi:hypothetical protein PspLS_00432 [Pyricularia sp. CBS 133598]|nr:hypothetical protein PspLS_00432 [Pyricularia sp. CBS 133598]
MRPTDAFGRQSRPAPESDDLGMSSFHHVTASQAMSYCVADESAVDASLDQSFSAFTSRARHDARKKDRQPAPVPRSEPAAGGPSSCSVTGVEEPSRSIPVTALHELLDRPLSPPTVKAPGSTPLNCSRPHQQQPMSTPMTPILLGVSGPGSTFSGLSSRRDSLSAGSLSEELGSMAGASEEGSAVDEGVDDGDPGATPMEHSAATAPQLVMPSIKMPSRRPFTEEGKAIGRLKVLIAGEKGIGKTSLIKSIVQYCEHIVHLDPIEPTPSTWETGPRTERAMQRAVTEIHGSTKAYPEWWADLDECRVLKRRNSLGDVIINRNICFVDTVGYGGGAKALQDIVPVVQYIESHLERMASNTLSDSDLANMIGGDGGPQVDVVLYLTSHDIKPVDLQYLRMLAPLTNIIPLIAKSDTIAADEIWERKQKVLSQLLSANVRPFRYSKVLPTSQAEAVLSVSSATGSDSEVMDASLLMSPDYVEPLLPSELGELVRQVFSADGASWLRHSAAKKCLQWRSGEQASKPQALYRPLNSWPPPAQGQTLPGGSQAPPFIGTTGELTVRSPASALALAPTVVRREEQLAQIRLANWAVELQRSLDSERARYEAIARGERAVWLTERLGECVKDGTLVAIGGQDVQRQNSRSRRSTSSSPAGPKVFRPHRDDMPTSDVQTMTKGLRLQSAHSQDPLGLLEMMADIKARSWVVLEVLGSVGVFGGLALWVTGRYWHAYPREDWRGCFALLGCNGDASGLFTRNNVWT